MKIGLLNVYSTRNIGDSAIYSALAELSPAPQVSAVIQDTAPIDTPGLQVVESLPACDAYISVGGDIFNNAREWFITKQFLKNLQGLRHAPEKTFVFGQSIPRSCHGLSFRLLASHFKRLAAVCVRDTESYERLRRLGVPVRLSYDTAFALSSQKVAEQAARDAIEPERAAIISVRLFDQMYQQDNQTFLKKIIELCRRLHKRGHQPVLLIQSEVTTADSDSQAVRTICEAVPQVKVLNIVQNSGDLAGWQFLMGIVAISRLAIGVRYHTSVLRLAANRMPFNLFYSNKGRDLSQRLQIPGASVADFDVDEHIQTIEKTAEMDFDSAPIRAQVQADFADCLRRIN